MAKKQNNVEAAVQAEMENENVVVNPAEETQETEQVQVEKPVKDAKPKTSLRKLVINNEENYSLGYFSWP